VISWPLARTRWLALAAGGGMVVLLALTVGFGFTPLTSMRKATLSILAAVVAALALEAAGIGRRRSVVAAVAVIAALTAVWVLQRVVEQAEGAAAWRVAIAAAAFVIAITAAHWPCCCCPPPRRQRRTPTPSTRCIPIRTSRSPTSACRRSTAASTR
jgi:peptidoglycan/LPS O-acetylase OafA/YrhL